MRIAMTLLVAALAVGAGCKKKENAATEGSGSAMAMGSGSAMAMGSGSAMAGSGSAMAMGSGSAMAGSGSAMAGSAMGSGADATNMAHHAGMCPSTVFGSTTKAELKGKEVIVTITSTDKDAVTAIQKRTDELLAAKKDKKAPTADHDMKGDHGGSMGLCPIHLPDGATAKAKNQKDGVAVTITPKDHPDALKTEIDGRITKAADWVKANIKPGDDKNQGGVGGGKANEGMNRSGSGDGKGIDRKAGGDGKGGGGGTGGGGGKGTGGGSSGKK